MALKQYSKQYKTTLRGKLRKEVESYASDEELRESDALRNLISKGIEMVRSTKVQKSARLSYD